MSTAIVTGATGILGRGIISELGAHPEEWKTIYAMSRSKKGPLPSHAIQAHLDLTAAPAEMAGELKDVDAEYVFFAAYLDTGDGEETSRVNGDMFDNFLKALEIACKVEHIRRIILVCGLKQYGVHLGSAKQPMEETDPWIPEPSYTFYYRQQRSLHAFCEKHNLEWVVTYPNEVVGFAEGNFMNLASALGIYAAVNAELGKELPFPGNETVYTRFDCLTSSKLHAEFCRWAAFAPKASNQAFNVVNGDVESWQNLWPKIAKRFNLKVPTDQFSRPAALPSNVLIHECSPLSLRAAEIGLEGRTPPDRVQQRIDLVQWSKTPEVQKAWNGIAQRHGLDRDALEKATWGFAGFVLGRSFDVVVNMTKARKVGFQGFADSWEDLCDVFGELEANRLLPATLSK